MHYYSLSDLKKDCLIDLNFHKLYKKFCPGPISFVLKLKRNSYICKSVTNNNKTIDTDDDSRFNSEEYHQKQHDL